jgi:metal-sulfur cluster biosynthetic enzyme
MMAGTDSLRAAILDQLSRVIDPETGVDVVRMRLVEDLAVDDGGRASFKFRPSSALCPLAAPLAQAIQAAVEQADGVTGADMQVVGYIQADELAALIREASGRLEGPGRA